MIAHLRQDTGDPPDIQLSPQENWLQPALLFLVNDFVGGDR
jgi:hypothetical protein